MKHQSTGFSFLNIKAVVVIPLSLLVVVIVWANNYSVSSPLCARVRFVAEAEVKKFGRNT